MPEIIILIIILIIFGPGKLPDLGKAIGKSIKDFKKTIHEPDDKKNDDSTKSHENENK